MQAQPQTRLPWRLLPPTQDARGGCAAQSPQWSVPWLAPASPHCCRWVHCAGTDSLRESLGTLALTAGSISSQLDAFVVSMQFWLKSRRDICRATMPAAAAAATTAS